jgi:hypothetical protein
MSNVSNVDRRFKIANQVVSDTWFYVYFLVTFSFLQTIYVLSAISSHDALIIDAKNQILHRVALDVAHNADNFPMEDKPNSTQSNYLQSLNQFLAANAYPIHVSRIDTVNLQHAKLNRDEVVILNGINEDIFVSLIKKPIAPLTLFSIMALVIAWIMAFGYAYLTKATLQNNKEATVDLTNPCKLILDLKLKSLVNPIDGNAVSLANKPLCFYAALIEFCIKYPELSLNPNKELPNEFSKLCRKYFSRLTELGHTIRKRPNFANNLEKTLSEIRAALDELYGDDITNKEFVYPKKAIGEGSRSKAHNFALTNLSSELVNILGS